eukprot:CAMPEP_0182432714 /NCGR_PEP_ID=MMETSP1167-20130531/58392_1 /TAXON_ID=2988 /ORGANISM="Mallomonas Sp, Strain CCMP3275" /LENGTH=640 /DNA_ID=CAMNT_0024620549 /DNA_START=477 /DNA_END=2399 /DNA_ORIENTATION=-
MMEQRLLLEAFESKGRLEYKDIALPTHMGVTDGTLFTDPMQRPGADVAELPAGFKISKFLVVHQEGMGIVGWQLMWSGDSMLDRESPKRGKWSGAGSEIHTLLVPSDDFLVAIEIVFEGSVITALRILNHLGGWSKYVGNRMSESANTVIMAADNVEKDPKAAKIGEEEKRSPGMPRNYITGITGLQNVTRATGMGIIVRRVRSHTIFSYYWVTEPPLVVKKAESVAPVWEMPPIASAVVAHLPQSRGVERHYKRPKLADMNRKGSGSVVSGLTSDSTKKEEGVLTTAEEEFFNVLRMRLTELHAAEGRAVAFARRIWSNPRFNRTSSPIMCSITIVPALTKWFFESLCKYLVPPPLSESKASALQKDARLIRIRGESVKHRIALLQTELGNIHYENNKWKIAKLGDKEKKAIRDEQDRRTLLIEEIEQWKTEADRIELAAQEMKKQGDGLLPVLQMSVRVCNNFKMKIKAARHLSSLLERMDIYTIKDRLSVTSTELEHSISAEDMELLSQRLRQKRVDSIPTPKLMTLNMIIAEDLKEEREREEQKLRQERIRDKEIKMAILSKTTDAKTAKELMQQRKITARRSLAVDPIRSVSSANRKSQSLSSSAHIRSIDFSTESRVVHIPSVNVHHTHKSASP